MKKFTRLNEMMNNPGNDGLNNGVANHYTPIENILINIKNLFCVAMSIVAEKGEDGVSVRLSSTKFTNERTIDDLLYKPMYNDSNTQSSTLYNYIISQGLTKCTKVNLGGGYWVVYFSPTDIKAAEDPRGMEADKANAIDADCAGCCDDGTCPCPCEANESFISEFEMTGMVKEDNEEELKSQFLEKTLALLAGTDKVKAAKQLELLVMNEINMPRDYYFAAIKFKSGEEAIALRWKYTTKMPFGKSDKEGEFAETSIVNVHSLLHIFGTGKKAIWVQDFSKDSIIKLPDEVKKLVDSILEILEAKSTSDPSVYSLGDFEDDGKDDKKDDDKKEDDKKEDDEKKEDDKKDNGLDDDDDTESDNDRGGNDDLLS